MALALATKQWIWLAAALDELNIPLTNAAMFCDKKAAIDIAHNHRICNKSNHIDVAYRFVREQVENGKITLLQVESANNLAYICTKGLPRLLFLNFGGKSGMEIKGGMTKCEYDFIMFNYHFLNFFCYVILS